MDFKVWTEQQTKDSKRYIFLDLDETLVHKIEVGWLKDTPENDNYASLLISGQHPYPEIKTVKAGGKTYHVFPRPRLHEWLITVSQFADCYTLTHSDQAYCDGVIKKYELSKYIKGCYSTGKNEPTSVGHQLDLQNSLWLLVDNMKLTSVEVVNKMRILGLVFPDETDVHSEGMRIIREARKHFVQVEDWYPHVDEHADNGLFKVMPEIRKKLNLTN